MTESLPPVPLHPDLVSQIAMEIERAVMRTVLGHYEQAVQQFGPQVAGAALLTCGTGVAAACATRATQDGHMVAGDPTPVLGLAMLLGVEVRPGRAGRSRTGGRQ